MNIHWLFDAFKSSFSHWIFIEYSMNIKKNVYSSLRNNQWIFKYTCIIHYSMNIQTFMDYSMNIQWMFEYESIVQPWTFKFWKIYMNVDDAIRGKFKSELQKSTF